MLSVVENGQESRAAVSVGGHRKIKGGKGFRGLTTALAFLTLI
jgi:hypothetical protein